MVALALAVFAVGFAMWMRGRPLLTDRSEWVQVTNYPDAVGQPALSEDGRMPAFVRGVSTFLAPGEVYIKMLPSGDPVQLTHDNLPKMSPVFSPDGSRVAYTVWDGRSWDTWVVPVLGGQPQLWLPNASGLVWAGPRRVLFSEIKAGEHMAIVAASESRAEARDVYVPPHQRGMAHRSYVSPDGKWALVVEMDNGEWLPCRLVPLNGESAGRPVGPAGASCTNAAWSRDGNWIYVSAHTGSNFHIWRQRFPGGEPEQLTSGPTEEEGIAPTPDGRSLLTAVGLRQRTVSVHDEHGDRQVSLEGYAYAPMFSPDGKKVYYRVLKGGISPFLGASELWVADVDSGRSEVLLPDFAVTHCSLSIDGSRIVFSALDSGHKSRLWLAPTDRRTAPRQVPNAEGDMAYFGPSGELVFHAVEGGSTLAIRIREDGTGRQVLTPEEVTQILGLSADGQWMIADQEQPRQGPTRRGAVLRSRFFGGWPAFDGSRTARYFICRFGRPCSLPAVAVEPCNTAALRHNVTSHARRRLSLRSRNRRPLHCEHHRESRRSPRPLRRTCMRSRDRRSSGISIGFRFPDPSEASAIAPESAKPGRRCGYPQASVVMPMGCWRAPVDRRGTGRPVRAIPAC